MRIDPILAASVVPILGGSALLFFGASLLQGQAPKSPEPLAMRLTPIVEKLDPELKEGEAFQPIFVRFSDQILKRGGDYESFAKTNETRPRAELRKEVLSSLQSKSETAYRGAAGEIESLLDKGLLRNVSRFWIVNGFAANAKPEACVVLAARADVEYVYLQRSPGNLRQNRPLPGSHPTEGADFEATKREFLRADRALIDSATKPETAWNLKRINAPAAWAEGATGKGVVVAINDGGIDPVPALQGAFWRNAKETLNGRDDDGNGYVDDVFGYDFRTQNGLVFGGSGQFHGTMCSGIVAGRPAGGQALQTGVAPDAKLMVLNGMGFLKVFEYALANGADIVSMSWMWVNFDMGHFRGVFRLALEHLAAAGVLPVGGAGNFATSAPEGRQITNPKDIPCCLSLAGIVSDGKRPAFSSKGPVSWKGVLFYDDYPELKKPDFSAPNGEFPVWVKKEGLPNRNWKTLWSGEGGEALIEGPRGNSFAGPHAAGVAALMLSVNPDLKPWQIQRIMAETCEDLETPGWDKESGAGLIQALSAVRKAKA